MRQLINELRNKADIPGPPYPLDAFAKIAGISSIEVGSLDIDGDLLKRGEALIIRASDEVHEYRRRFTIAHEIAHASAGKLHERRLHTS